MDPQTTNSPNNATINRTPKLGEEVMRIYFMDGSYKAIRLNPDKTNVEELWALTAEKLNMPETSAACFFVWGWTDQFELLLYNHPKISEVRKQWHSYEERYNPVSQSLLKSMTVKLKASASSELKSEMNNTSLTASKGSTESRRQLQKQGSVLNMTTISSEDEHVFRFLFRTTAICTSAEEKACSDPPSIHLFYLQAVYNVINSNYPCDIDMAVKLGGVQLQLTIGNRNVDTHKTGHLSATGYVEKFVPVQLYKDLKPEEWEERLLHAWNSWNNYDQIQLKNLYLDLVRQWPYYGSTFFRARYEQNDSFFQNQCEGKIRIAINENGLHLITPKPIKVITYTWAEISGWDSEKNIFFFSVKDIEKGSLFKIKKKPTKFYQFKSTQAELINDFMCDWAEVKGRNDDPDKRKSRSHSVFKR